MASALSLGKRIDRHASGSPAITYRHLLSSHSMTPTNPLRVIAHCDIDAAYAQFEMVRLGIPRDQPVCVQQWTGLIAVNYPARKFGITRHMDVNEARKRCPELQTVHVATYREGETEPGYWGEGDPKHHKVSLDPYRRESAKILAVFKRMVPEGEVEKASIDEAYLDLTALTISEILRRHNHLAGVPHDAPQGEDTPLPPPPPVNWDPVSSIFPIGGENVSEQEGEVEQFVDSMTDEIGSWQDYALSVGAELMDRIRSEVKRELGYTCSAGIAHNKTLAKLCSAWKKPDAQTVLRQSAVSSFLNPMEFTKIRFLGGKLGEAMAKEYDANTVEDMLKVSLEEMQDKFGDESIWVFNILRGIDYNPVKERTATKSMLASKNITPYITSREGGYHWLGILAGELFVRLRDARDESGGLWPKTMVLSTRQVRETPRSRQIAFPYTRNLNSEYILKYARRVWDEVAEAMTRPTNVKLMKINNLGLSFSGLERLESGQKGIEGFFSAKSIPANGLKRYREGDERSSTDLEVDECPLTIGSEGVIELADSSDEELMDPAANRLASTCPICAKKLKVDYDDMKINKQAAQHSLETLVKEHQSWHTTQSRKHGDFRRANKKKRKAEPKKPEGIRAFFTPASNGQSNR